MTVTTRPLDTVQCSHDGIHGPDSEPGAAQRCTEETIALRVEHSPEGRAATEAVERLQNELIPALIIRTARETMRREQEVGTLTNLVMEPSDDYGRSKPWDAEGIDGMTEGRICMTCGQPIADDDMEAVVWSEGYRNATVWERWLHAECVARVVESVDNRPVSDPE